METKSIETLLAARVDGVIASLAMETTGLDHFDRLERRGVPLVFFDRVPEGMDYSKVTVDDEELAYRAVKHLVDTGARRIAHFGGPAAVGIRSVMAATSKFTQSSAY